MTALQSLNLFLRKLELRSRFLAASRGTALVAVLALVLTILFVYLANKSQFATGVVLPLRILLFASLAVSIAVGLAVPFLRINRRKLTSIVESRIPELNQRLTTITERPDAENPFTELLAEDALQVAQSHRATQLFDIRHVLLFAGSGLAATICLLLLITMAPGFWGYGASLLWTGRAAAGRRPVYDIVVQPGNKTIRRRSDQAIYAQLTGFSAHRVILHAKYGSALKWEAIAMQSKSDGSKYQFLFAGLSDPVEYYVQADGAQSRHYTINVKDLPAVRRVRVGIHYPSGLGLQDVINDPGGDIRAVQGTEANIAVLTDRPLDHGLLVTETGDRIPLTRTEGNWASARLHIQKDGSYHIAAIDSGETIRVSDDYFIEAKKDEPPTVRIVNPGRDPHVSIIEEVPVTVSATDDFGVNGLDLHYSVNGGPEQVIPLLKQKGVRDAEGKSTLYFENFKVVPGDLVSIYATARDAKTTSRSELVFAQAEPFDFKFSQSQQAGGGGMGGMGMGDSNNISERQKQIIAATFNEIRDPGKARVALQEDARFLSDLQGKLGEQAKTLAERMASRELGANGSQFTEFSRLMTQASVDMGTAVNQLKPAKWQDALPPEQKALQGLLRAEALFRDIQVAFGQRSGGGGGGGGAQRDLARMFDLELDTSKNQYETGRSSDSAAGGDQQKAIDEAFEKLQMLARRQQELAAQNSQKQDFEQRWEEEQLRREAEELRQQMQQLAQNSQNGQQSSSNQQSGGSQASQGGSSSSSSRSSSRAGQNADNNRMNDALRQTTNALERAENEMRKAVSERDATAQQRAAAQLKEAQNTLNRMLHDQAGNSVSDLAGRAQDIANQQKELANRIKQMYGNGSDGQRGRDWQSARNSGNQPSEGGGEAMPEMNDPNSTRFGYGFRRRYWQQEMQPTHTPTEQEKAVAAEKERLAAQLEQLEKQMGQQAENMSGTRPDASSKMRRALSEAEQKELALRMQKNAEWIRQGYGDRNVGMEDSVSAGVDQLSRDLRDVQSALNNSQPGNQGAGKDDRTAEALNEIRQLREQLARGDQSNNGSQQSGQQGGNGAFSPRGGPSNNLGRSDLDRGLDARDVQSAIRQLNGLRGQVDPNDHALYGYIDGVLGNLHHLTGAQAGLLDARISQDTVTSLERLEMELNKRMAQGGIANGARTGATEQTPESYRNAVAEYFKRLSQPK